MVRFFRYYDDRSANISASLSNGNASPAAMASAQYMLENKNVLKVFLLRRALY